MYDPSGMLAVICAVILLAAWISDHSGVPVIGIVPLLGILLGPDGAGILETGAMLQMLGTLSIIFLMFLAGVEARLSIQIRMKPGEMLRQTLPDFMIACILGAATTILLGRPVWQAAAFGLFLATAGSGVFAPGKERSHQIHSSAAAAKDLAVAIAVLVLHLTVSAPSFPTALMQLGVSLLAASLAWIAAPWLITLFFRVVRPGESMEISFLLLLLYGSSYAVSFAGVPAWFLAYTLGLSLSKSIGSSRELGRKLSSFGTLLFMPAGLLLAGASLQLAPLLADPAGSAITIVAVLLTCAGVYLVQAAWNRIDLGRQRRNAPADSISFGLFSLLVAWILAENSLLDPQLHSAAYLLVIAGAGTRALLKKPLPASMPLMQNQHVTDAGAAMATPRMLIALSNPVSSASLLELAALLQGENRTVPLLPLVVRAPVTDDQSPRREAETLLAEAVTRATELGKPVVPLQMVSLNPAEGIVRAAEEHAADCILLGWNKPPRLAHAFFGSVIENTITSSSLQVMAVRAVQPWKGIQHLIVIAPESVVGHPGFRQAAGMISILSKGLHVRLHIVALDRNPDLVFQAFRKGINEVPDQIRADSWRTVPHALTGVPQGRRAIWILLARPEECSYHPAIERLPHLLAESMPDANVVACYLASQSAADISAGTGQGPATSSVTTPSRTAATAGTEVSAMPATLNAPERQAGAFSNQSGTDEARSAQHLGNRLLSEALEAGRIRIHLQHTAIADAIYDLVFTSLAGRQAAELQELADRMIDSAMRQPIELEPGVILLHERIPEILNPVIALGARREGYRIGRLEQPVQVLVVMLVPDSQSTQDHLRTLGALVGLFRRQFLKSRLLTASRAEDILARKEQ
ncbi:MAG: cation:proton antiporter [Rectinemataceae bacterium]